jgi:mycothiol synthase
MSLTLRRYAHEEDYWRMRDFLRTVYEANHRSENSWHVARLEYARWHVMMNCAKTSLQDVVYLWVLDVNLISFIIPDGGPGEAHLIVHPDFDDPLLEEMMITQAESSLSLKSSNEKVMVQ